MANTPKKKKIVSAATGEEVTAGQRKVKQAAPVGNATGLRIGAVALWLVAIAFEVLALLIFKGIINWSFLPTMALVIIALVLDLICIIIGSLLWKKANRIDPASAKNKLKFWLWNNMGLIACTLAFVPFIILALTDKKADKKSKAIVSVVAVIALLIGGLLGYDWDPVSQEELDAAKGSVTGLVYWVGSGEVYHTSIDCSSLNRTAELTEGTVEEAYADGHTRLCYYCSKRDNIEGVRTEEGVEDTSETTPVETTPAE